MKEKAKGQPGGVRTWKEEGNYRHQQQIKKLLKSLVKMLKSLYNELN